MFGEPLLVNNFLERGASAYLTKDNLINNVLSTTILKVYNREEVAGEMATSKLHFNEKQKVLMPLVFENYTNEQIADKLDLSTRAIEKQRSELYTKSGGKTAMDFYKFAFSKGLQFLRAIFHKKD
jgi:DNA-binding NarL/FixJ family response regulator